MPLFLSGSTEYRPLCSEPGVLPEEFPQTRERRIRKPLAQEAQPLEAVPAEEMVAEEEQQPESMAQDERPAEALPASVIEAFAQTLEDAQAAGEPVAEIVAAMADGEAINAEVIEDGSDVRLLVITAEPENTEAMAQPESDVPVKKSAGKGKSKKGVATTDSAEK